MGYLDLGAKEMCFGCEVCVQSCPTAAIRMREDEEGFRYPVIESSKCVSCGLCRRVCPYDGRTAEKREPMTAFGGHHTNPAVQRESTSGGAFTAIVDAWWDGTDCVIFGAAASGLEVRHTYITDKRELGRFRKSKYAQSHIENAYEQTKDFLRSGKKVLFSGTPCQIAGLKAFLGGSGGEGLLTVEVVCEGVPSPLFMRGYERWIRSRYGCGISELDYRNKDRPRWDFQVMKTSLESGKHLYMDRWMNPFWSIWLSHLMSRPSCYSCPFAARQRAADITLGDLWGVHLYCPELYDRNRGASLIVCNTNRGRDVLERAKAELSGHELDLEEALKYQSPMRRTIDADPRRGEFMCDLKKLPYKELCRKWAKRPSLRLLWSKYIWGNRQRVFFWNVKQKGMGR